jgi:hypothetical protein
MTFETFMACFWLKKRVGDESTGWLGGRFRTRMPDIQLNFDPGCGYTWVFGSCIQKGGDSIAL